MGHMRFGVSGAVAVLAFCFLGCESEQTTTTSRPIDSEEATAKVNQRVDAVLTGLSDATAEIDTTDSTKVATDGMNGALGNERCGNSGSNNLATESTDTVDSIPKESTDKLGEALKRLRDEAKEHVFREELVESKDGNQVVYKMDPAQTCDGDSECITKLTKNPLRFAVTANNDDSLNVALLVGEDRHSPATAVLSDNKIALRGNLAEAMDAIKLFVDAADQDDLPDKLVGSVEWSIEKRAEGDFAFTGSILERLELVVGQAKGSPISVAVQPSNPTSQITINSVTNTVGFKENLGAVDISVAGSVLCDDDGNCGQKEQAGTFYFHLGGFSGEVQTAAGASELTFSGLGLGTDSSYVALNQDRLASVDLNPNNGRKLSINFKKIEGGTLVTFDPALDLQVAMAMNKLSESMRVDMPEWLANEVFDVTLGGAAKPSILIPSPVCNSDGTSTTKEQLKVVSGSLSLDATSIANPIEVAANMCLVPSESEATDGAHPFSLLSAGTCQ